MIIARAPGRINLIGEHTDYNSGYVLPASIDKYTEARVNLNGYSTQCNIYSETLNKSFSFDLENMIPGEITWENYIKGVIYQFLKLRKLKGFDCTIHSTIPLGSGMSSSAALTCALSLALDALFEMKLDRLQIAKMCQKADHQFVGIKSGIMDQFASLFGKKNYLLLLDCETLTYNYHKFDIGKYACILLNTNVSHELTNSEYNKRQAECLLGLVRLKNKYPSKNNFKEYTLLELETIKDQLDHKVYQRCTFVIKENLRVLETLNALETNDLKKVGQLLYASHEGLKNEYEVSCPELDFLVSKANSYKEILGARMMGGGFGGCTINLIDKNHITRIVDKLKTQYFNEFGIRLTSYEVSVVNGAQILS